MRERGRSRGWGRGHLHFMSALPDTPPQIKEVVLRGGEGPPAAAAGCQTRRFQTGVKSLRTPRGGVLPLCLACHFCITAGCRKNAFSARVLSGQLLYLHEAEGVFSSIRVDLRGGSEKSQGQLDGSS